MGISITVIIPVYNVEKYLTDCLESVVNQLQCFDEVILINDGSTDNSLAICENYVLQYPYFKLISQDNQGLSAARNVGLNLASSEYILFLDSDDYLRKDTVTQLKSKLKQFPYDAVYFDTCIHCEDGFEINRNAYDRSLMGLDGIQMSGWEYFCKTYPDYYYVPVWMAIYKKELIDYAGITFPNGLYYEDNYFSFLFITYAKYVVHISEKLYQRRYRKNSIITSCYSIKKFIDYIKIILLIWNEISDRKENEFVENKDILAEFINGHCSIVLGNHQLCTEHGIKLNNDEVKMLICLFNKYESLMNQYIFTAEVKNIDFINSIIKTLKQIYRLTEENIEIKLRTMQTIKIFIDKQKKLYQKLLQELPLCKKELKVGIYGTGKHTENFLRVFEMLVGKVKCDLVFIDSYLEGGLYQGKEIINYQKIDKRLQFIIISSFLYEQEMIKNVKKVNCAVPVYTFYSMFKGDIFSECELFDTWDVYSEENKDYEGNSSINKNQV